MDTTSAPEKSQDHPLLRRGNSIAASVVVAPTKLRISDRNYSTTFPSDDFELLPIKPAASHSYSSLRDLLPPMAAVNSPNPKSAQPWPEISIRNRLVKQAARAYLRPMSTSPGSTGGDIFRRFWKRVAAVIDFLCRSVIRALDGTLGLSDFGALDCNGRKCAWFDC